MFRRNATVCVTDYETPLPVDSKVEVEVWARAAMVGCIRYADQHVLKVMTTSTFWRCESGLSDDCVLDYKGLTDAPDGTIRFLLIEVARTLVYNA